MRRTIRFINMAATRTGARGVARVNRDNRHAHLLRLVLDKAAKLGKGPAMQLRSLRLTNRYPFADVRQLFQRNPALSAFSLSHNFLADLVVGMSGKTLLFAGQLAQTPPCRVCAFALQLGTQPPMAKAHVVDCLSGHDSDITINGNIRHAEVNAFVLLLLNLS